VLCREFVKPGAPPGRFRRSSVSPAPRAGRRSGDRVRPGRSHRRIDGTAWAKRGALRAYDALVFRCISGLSDDRRRGQPLESHSAMAARLQFRCRPGTAPPGVPFGLRRGGIRVAFHIFLLG